MKLWKLTQSEHRGWDTYDTCIVAAESEEEAKQIHPNDISTLPWETMAYHCWASIPEFVQAELIGEAVEGTREGVILASFNAG